MEIENIKKLFNPLYSRLYEIKSCEIQFPEPFDSQYNFVRSLDPEIYLYPEIDSLSHVELALSIIEEINALGNELVKNLDVPIEGWYNTFEENTTIVNGEDYFKSTKEEYRKVRLEKLKNELDSYSQCLEKIKHNLLVRIGQFDQAGNKKHKEVLSKIENAAPNRLKSFIYKNYDKNQESITLLKSSLIKHNLIDKDSSLADFRKIFTHEIVANPIRWTGGISALTYFVKLLIKEHKTIELPDNYKQKHWQVTAACFVDKNGNPFDWQKFRLQKEPVNKAQLEKIAKIL